MRTNEKMATVSVGRYQQSYGTVTHVFEDGRLRVDAGGRMVTGLPVSPFVAAVSEPAFDEADDIAAHDAEETADAGHAYDYGM